MESLSAFTGEERMRIAGTMQNPDDDDFGVGIAVISVVPEKMDTQARGQLIAGGAELGMGKERLEAFAELVHKRARRLGIVGGDEDPDLGKSMIRIISARKANKRETRRYHDYFKTKA